MSVPVLMTDFVKKIDLFAPPSGQFGCFVPRGTTNKKSGHVEQL
jgi:hypothetical protein